VDRPDPRRVDSASGTRTPLEPLRELVATIPRLAFARTVPEIQGIVGRAARQLIAADGATFVLRDGHQCYYADEDAIAPLWKGRRFPLQSCISGWAMLHRQSVCIEDIYADNRIPHDAYRPTFVQSLAMMPIRTPDPIGAIGTYWRTRHRATADEIELLQALADSTAVALENVQTYRALQEAQRETLHRLALAGEYRDDATHAHTRRVGRLVGLIARELGLAEADAQLMSEASLLHDLGKIAVPDTVLLKPGKLHRAEVHAMRQHTHAGAAILAGSTSPVLILAREIALTHHEWWDGSGYPNGLSGEDIPLSGRIVAAADVFDALTHARPYKPAWPVQQAMAEIRRFRNRQFDPAVVDALSSLDVACLVFPADAELVSLASQAEAG
jgi:response regulator RpfG family c-di-GMP phosphodiesterase